MVGKTEMANFRNVNHFWLESVCCINYIVIVISNYQSHFVLY